LSAVSDTPMLCAVLCAVSDALMFCTIVRCCGALFYNSVAVSQSPRVCTFTTASGVSDSLMMCIVTSVLLFQML
jgi:hypothetical protein